MIIEHSASGGQSVWAAPSASQLTGEVIVRLSPETFNNEEENLKAYEPNKTVIIQPIDISYTILS